MNEAIDIRAFNPGDRVGYLRLMSAVFGEPAAHNDYAATLDRVIAVADSSVFVALDDEQVIGAAIGGYDGCRGWLYSVAVSPAHRRRGVGRRLTRAVESTLAARGCVKVNLQVRAENSDVTAFYQSIGYAVEERVSMGKRLGAG